MALGDIQGIEIVIVVFDLAVVLDRIAHRNENVFDLLTYDRAWMEMSGARPAAGNRDVKPLALGLGPRNEVSYFRFGFSDLRSDIVFNRLDKLAKGPAFFGRNLSY